jgi:hydrogenase maturation protein HypF
MGEQDMRRNHYRITGQVQGVGFRPFIYRLAGELGLSGWVNNDWRGVTIEVQGSPDALETFSRRLREELPPLAAIETCEQVSAGLVSGENRFVIRASEGADLADPAGQGTAPAAQVTVDTAVCPDCLREMNDPADPRHGYAFINCTNCGPRYTIVRRIPYDRPNTTMDSFVMCPLCRGEYENPRSRRFHAQPIACPTCGPRLWLVDTRGKAMQSPDPVARTAELLADGKIVAIKGLGGFHLACRADDDHVVHRLRRRKQRDAKPFAVMVATIERAQEYCRLTPQAMKILAGAIRPILLLPAIKPSDIAPSVAEGLSTLGIMLPYTPLHHLLFARRELATVPLVMTSGNFSEEPLVKDNDAAVAHLGQIADALLLHDRPIERRVDDSVVQMHSDGGFNVLRRARGYAPAPVSLGEGRGAKIEGRRAKGEGQNNEERNDEDRNGEKRNGEGRNSETAVLAVGPELKNTVCLLGGGRAILSEHIGDLKDGRAYRHFIDTINHLEALFEIHPRVIAADLHPQYLSTQYALRRHRGELTDKEPLPIVRVQHHHAHIVACMAENGCTQPVIGLACDGVGLGDDGAVWGCEVLRAERGDYQRLGHLRYVPLWGGDAAAVETARPALAALWDTFGREMLEMPLAQQLAGGAKALETAVELLSAGVNCPPSSSLGRWFDAVAGLCGLAARNDFEGQAPMKLEGAIVPGVENYYDFKIIQADAIRSAAAGPTAAKSQAAEEGPQAEEGFSGQRGVGSGIARPSFLIDLRPMVAEIVGELSAGYEVGVIAGRFHNTVSQFLLAAAVRAREMTGLGVVALSGGCFANQSLLARLKALLGAEDFQVLTHRTTPPNDGCVALGQAIVAAAQSPADVTAGR